jgi:GDPmannose 4,6-dehydratase
MAHWACINYCESFNVFACSGILFNHESPMRGKEFVTRKITSHFAELMAGKTTQPLELGNLNAQRDWGYSGDYVEMMWKMLQHDKPDFYVIATGERHSIRGFVEEAGKHCGYELNWESSEETEVGIDKKTGKTIVKVNPQFYRPAEVEILIGNPEKAKKILNWNAQVDFKALCRMMMLADIERVEKRIL